MIHWGEIELATNQQKPKEPIVSADFNRDEGEMCSLVLPRQERRYSTGNMNPKAGRDHLILPKNSDEMDKKQFGSLPDFQCLTIEMMGAKTAAEGRQKRQKAKKVEEMKNFLEKVKNFSVRWNIGNFNAKRGTSPSGKSPSGKSPSGKSPSGTSPSGKSPLGKSPSGNSSVAAGVKSNIVIDVTCHD